MGRRQVPASWVGEAAQAGDILLIDPGNASPPTSQESRIVSMSSTINSHLKGHFN